MLLNFYFTFALIWYGNISDRLSQANLLGTECKYLLFDTAIQTTTLKV